MPKISTYSLDMETLSSFKEVKLGEGPGGIASPGPSGEVVFF